jgi:hypothetical protein
MAMLGAILSSTVFCQPSEHDGQRDGNHNWGMTNYFENYNTSVPTSSAMSTTLFEEVWEVGRREIAQRYLTKTLRCVMFVC